MKPQRAWIHPAVEQDFAEMIEKRSPLPGSVGDGWCMVEDVWLREGLPFEIRADAPVINEFRLVVIDEFDCTFLFGWRERDQMLALLSVTGTRLDQSLAQTIERYRSRVETKV